MYERSFLRLSSRHQRRYLRACCHTHLAQGQARSDSQWQSQRLDDENHGREKARDDVAAEDSLDFGNAGVEGERCVDLDEPGSDGGEQNLRVNVKSQLMRLAVTRKATDCECDVDAILDECPEEDVFCDACRPGPRLPGVTNLSSCMRSTASARVAHTRSPLGASPTVQPSATHGSAHPPRISTPTQAQIAEPNGQNVEARRDRAGA